MELQCFFLQMLKLNELSVDFFFDLGMGLYHPKSEGLSVYHLVLKTCLKYLRLSPKKLSVGIFHEGFIWYFDGSRSSQIHIWNIFI